MAAKPQSPIMTFTLHSRSLQSLGWFCMRLVIGNNRIQAAMITFVCDWIMKRSLS